MPVNVLLEEAFLCKLIKILPEGIRGGITGIISCGIPAEIVVEITVYYLGGISS